MISHRKNPIIVIDNYDSFTYNLINQIRTILPAAIPIEVYRNDAITVDSLFSRTPRALILSPGPGDEQAGGISLACLSRAAPLQLPVLGVCLGHQLIAAWCGATITRSARPIHGKSWQLFHTEDPLFLGMSNPLIAARYHSLVVDPATLPATLHQIAWTAEGEIMALRHQELPWYGVQFHPESFLSEKGELVVRNFFSLTLEGENGS